MELRGGVSFLVNIIYLNVNLKHACWDSVTKGLKLKLAYKVFGSVISVFLGYNAVFYFPLTYSTAMRNVSPFYALIFSAICAKEPATLKQVLLLTVITSLVLALVIPSYDDGDAEGGAKSDLLEGLSSGEKIFAWTCLLTFPVFTAVMTLMNRLLKELHENTASTYGNFIQLFMFLGVSLALSEDTMFFTDFTGGLWALMLGTCVFQVISQVYSFKAS